MFDKTFAVYLGKNSDNKAAGFVVEDGLFCSFEINQEEAENQIRVVAEEIRSSLRQADIVTFDDFTFFVSSLINAHGLASVSAGYLHGSKLYIYTKGASALLLRKKKLYRIAERDAQTQGMMEPMDSVFFGTSSIIPSFPVDAITREAGNSQEPRRLVEVLEENLQQKTGTVLVAQFSENGKSFTEEMERIPARTDGPFFSPAIFLQKKNILRLALLVFLAIGLWKTVGIANQAVKDRREEQFIQNLTALEDRYGEVSRSFAKNPSEALDKIEELAKDTADLAKKYPHHSADLAGLLKNVDSLKKTVGTGEVSPDEVFFDLKLIGNKAAANYADFTKEYASILDTAGKKAYLINVASKSHETFPLTDLTNPTLVTEYNGVLFVFDKGKGIYKGGDEKLARIIPPDKEWGNVTDMKVFNSNIYLLDKGKDEIYKYIPAEDGYSSKISYFQSGQSIDLLGAQNMSIDFSIYILSSDRLWKYTGGSKDDFSPDQHLDYGSFARVFKGEEADFIYLLDNANARIVALNEKGRLMKSVFNAKLKEARFFGVYNDEKILFQHQNKIYSLDKF